MQLVLQLALQVLQLALQEPQQVQRLLVQELPLAQQAQLSHLR
jgi:hypothetical protein